MSQVIHHLFPDQQLNEIRKYLSENLIQQRCITNVGIEKVHFLARQLLHTLDAHRFILVCRTKAEDIELRKAES